MTLNNNHSFTPSAKNTFKRIINQLLVLDTNKGFCNIITTLDASKLYIALTDEMR